MSDESLKNDTGDAGKEKLNKGFRDLLNQALDMGVEHIEAQIPEADRLEVEGHIRKIFADAKLPWQVSYVSAFLEGMKCSMAAKNFPVKSGLDMNTTMLIMMRGIQNRMEKDIKSRMPSELQ